MGRQKCPVCGGDVIRYGKTRAGSQRWQCPACKATSTRRIDNAAKLLAAFLGWLLSGRRQADMPGGGRTFRRKCARFWEVWPIAPVTGEVHRVVFVDGIYLARNVVVLIAATEEPRWAFDTEDPELRAYLRESTPREFRWHNLFLGPNVLQRA